MSRLKQARVGGRRSLLPGSLSLLGKATWNGSRLELESDRLHLGAFNQVHQGWITTDVTPHIFVARVPGLAFLLHKAGILSEPRYEEHKEGVFREIHYLDATRRFPFPDAMFRYVFSSHMLEHLHPRDAERCVREVHRVLRPGGIFRVSIPDLDLHIREFDPERPEEFLEFVYGCHGGEDESCGHKWCYNERSLSDLLYRVGFEEVQRRGFRQGRCVDVAVLDNRPRSLFLEAVR